MSMRPSVFAMQTVEPVRAWFRDGSVDHVAELTAWLAKQNDPFVHNEFIENFHNAIHELAAGELEDGSETDIHAGVLHAAAETVLGEDLELLTHEDYKASAWGDLLQAIEQHGWMSADARKLYEFIAMGRPVIGQSHDGESEYTGWLTPEETHRLLGEVRVLRDENPGWAPPSRQSLIDTAFGSGGSSASGRGFGGIIGKLLGQAKKLRGEHPEVEKILGAEADALEREANAAQKEPKQRLNESLDGFLDELVRSLDEAVQKHAGVWVYGA